MIVIGVGHYKRTGKDTFANALIRKCYELNPKLRVIKQSWAWKLKQITHELYGWAGLREPEFYETKDGESLREVILPEIGKSPRQIWIDFGTPAVRECVYEHTWRDYLMKSDHDCDVMIVPDTRFMNEVEGIIHAGGHLVKVVRPGYGPGKNKPDRELQDFRGWDNIIGHVGTMQHLEDQAQLYAHWLCGRAVEPGCTGRQMGERLAVEVVEPWEDDLPQNVVNAAFVSERRELQCG
jgi:hypothetical protein